MRVSKHLLRDPFLNKGSAFTALERRTLNLNGLLPPAIKTLEEQSARVYLQYQNEPNDLAKNRFLTALHDRNETLFYAVTTEHLKEMLPIIYTPTVGDAIEHFSRQYQRPRGLYLSAENPTGIEEAFLNYNVSSQDIDLIVATDAEAILEIGDWGVGGIEIAIGKLAVYTAAAGINPRRATPRNARCWH